MQESEIRMIVLLKLTPVIFLFLIIFAGLIGDCSNSVDPMDNSVMKQREIVRTIEVTDTTYAGFRITYITARSVTKPRLEEISSRPHIQKAFSELEREAPLYFNNDMLHTDIYDFAGFARKFDVDPDVKIHCIFVIGAKKVALYAQPNPAIPNSESWINPNTEQGVLWINSDDVYYGYMEGSRTYRYWKCRSIYSTSDIDEQFIHFSEDQRLF